MLQRFFLILSLFALNWLKIHADNTADANNAFALSFYQQLAVGSSENFFFSPYSFREAFGVCALGAKGKTLEELNRIFGFQNDNLASLRKTLTNLKGVTLHIANGLWVDSHYSLLPEFVKQAQRQAKVQLESVDFRKNAEVERIKINDWVEKQTEQKIQDLFPPETITSATELVIANAIYFLGKWEEPFDPSASQEALFHLANGNEIKATYFTDKRTLPYVEKKEFQAVQLDYKDRQFSMIILLPKTADGLANLEKKLNVTEWQQIFSHSFKPVQVVFRMPRFKQEYNLVANDALKQTGLTTAFSAEADFSALSSEPLFITTVIHKAFVEVNEAGTEAAAATGIIMETTARQDPTPIPIFNADHPFLFAIRENKTGALLFLGRCMKP